MKVFVCFNFLLLNSIVVFCQDVIKQEIWYEVPISHNVNLDEFGNIESLRADSEITVEEMNILKYYRLDKEVLTVFIKSLLHAAKTGEIDVYDNDSFRDDFRENGIVTPDDYFKKKLTLEELNNSLTYTDYSALPLQTGFDELGRSRDSLDENGFPVYPSYEYEYEDFISIRFHEEWIIDTKTNIITKNVKGFLLGVDYCSTIVDAVGPSYLFYVKNSKKAKGKVDLNKNIITSVPIKGWTGRNNDLDCFNCISKFESLNYEKWWDNNLIITNRISFVGKNDYAPFLSSNKKLKVYNTDSPPNNDGEFPWGEDNVLSDEEIKKSNVMYQSLVPLQTMPDAYGVTYDSLDMEANYVYPPPRTYEFSDIYYIGFVEEWSYDPETFSILKEVKGVMPVVIEREFSSGEMVGLKSSFCIRYE